MEIIKCNSINEFIKIVDNIMNEINNLKIKDNKRKHSKRKHKKNVHSFTGEGIQSKITDIAVTNESDGIVHINAVDYRKMIAEFNRNQVLIKKLNQVVINKNNEINRLKSIISDIIRTN